MVHTVDLAARNERDIFTLGGDQMISYRSGYRVGAAQVDDSLMEHPTVLEAGVIKNSPSGRECKTE